MAEEARALAAMTQRAEAAEASLEKMKKMVHSLREELREAQEGQMQLSCDMVKATDEKGAAAALQVLNLGKCSDDDHQLFSLLLFQEENAALKYRIGKLEALLKGTQAALKFLVWKNTSPNFAARLHNCVNH